MHKKTTATEIPVRSFSIYIELNYSAFKVKRLKSTIFNSGSAAANTSLTVFLESIIFSWFSKQTSFKNLGYQLKCLLRN